MMNLGIMNTIQDIQYQGTWDQYLITYDWGNWHINSDPSYDFGDKKDYFLCNDSTGETLSLGYLGSCGIVSVTESEAFLLLDLGYVSNQFEQPTEQYRLMNQEQVFDTIFTLPIFDFADLLNGIYDNAYPFPVADEHYKYGYIDDYAEWIIKPQYMDASPFVLLDENNPYHQQLMGLSNDTLVSGTKVAIVYTFDEKYIIIDESNSCLIDIGDYCHVVTEMEFLNSIFFHY